MALSGAVIAVLGIGAPSAAAGTINVTTTHDQYGSDASECALREAVVAANRDQDFGGCTDSAGPDKVKLGEGHYRLKRSGGGEDKSKKGDLDVLHDLRIAGAGTHQTVIDAKVAHDRVLDVIKDANATLDSLTLQHGHARRADGGAVNTNAGKLSLSHVVLRKSHADQSGGGIANFVGDITLRHSVISGNAAGDNGEGGGILTVDGALKLIHSTVSGNRTPDTAGGIFAAGGAVSLKHSKVSGNSALDGGGIVQNNGSLKVMASTIAGNRAGTMADAHARRAAHGLGGGILTDADVTIVDSTVSGNEASQGGGLRLFGTDATIENSTISGNNASGTGGGLWVDASDSSLVLTINNVTVANNVAGLGGGIYQDSGAVLAYNSIFGDNTAPTSNDCATTALGANYDLIEDDAGCNGIGANNVIGEDPMLENLARNGGETKSHALGPLSPAINAANPAAPESEDGACLPKDQRGHDRPDGSRCDIGAFERHLTP
jgi:CSLREA domain-containing protein